MYASGRATARYVRCSTVIGRRHTEYFSPYGASPRGNTCRRWIRCTLTTSRNHAQPPWIKTLERTRCPHDPSSTTTTQIRPSRQSPCKVQKCCVPGQSRLYNQSSTSHTRADASPTQHTAPCGRRRPPNIRYTLYIAALPGQQRIFFLTRRPPTSTIHNT